MQPSMSQDITTNKHMETFNIRLNATAGDCQSKNIDVNLLRKSPLAKLHFGKSLQAVGCSNVAYVRINDNADSKDYVCSNNMQENLSSNRPINTFAMTSQRRRSNVKFSDIVHTAPPTLLPQLQAFRAERLRLYRLCMSESQEKHISFRDENSNQDNVFKVPRVKSIGINFRLVWDNENNDNRQRSQAARARVLSEKILPENFSESQGIKSIPVANDCLSPTNGFRSPSLPAAFTDAVRPVGLSWTLCRSNSSSAQNAGIPFSGRCRHPYPLTAALKQMMRENTVY